MAGLQKDPAFERWAHLRENTHLYFRWNKRTVNKTLFWGIVIPVGLTILSYKTDRKWDFTGAQTKKELNMEK
ncbi:NADH-ubiquinone oxidoreductase subunit [Phycomyces blakesleeanus]|uniref:NADH-ubiquinone oxidoreductase subunit n=2 Tax=Phycomyces blakesleeanus TaxID=4837 RepID=A0A167L6T4_PHYB8|nr:NADH-ubiquinone oxidoreductase subunit [Phycomyces blakesleeanus NRRL 1555(-)]OAD69725.1 NADH-ubiquinone oxidoreductase subunit [Phycomyces blakesleeanus NRRL 1555(-)]|eukprot:XP_018287765.1 NADH-ubiquinone oxidoreductase subunit [Phycomyces blakesleeanus NRRL 1555(-)]